MSYIILLKIDKQITFISRISAVRGEGNNYNEIDPEKHFYHPIKNGEGGLPDLLQCDMTWSFLNRSFLRWVEKV